MSDSLRLFLLFSFPLVYFLLGIAAIGVFEVESRDGLLAVASAVVFAHLTWMYVLERMD